ncbi:50S ribosomal protein L22 [Candidatus Poriferisodalis sp.]|uniref:50S ribosomal protein L22 n=1 Tax=Candidatus Poriferisodalis sp. TaxID=3101277 RepID=UPI003B0203EF
MSGLIDLDVIAGAKATHRFARLSASKARVVLNLIRDEDLGLARDRLRFCERGAAEVVAKVLESAVANASNNEQLDPDELYVAECWADEGPVLKRWRPRARGRATRILKQTCHITVVVAQLSTDELAMREARLAASGATTGAVSRAARVAASRGEAPAEADEPDETAEIDTAEIDTAEIDTADFDTAEIDGSVDETEIEAGADTDAEAVAEGTQDSDSSEADAAGSDVVDPEKEI